MGVEYCSADAQAEVSRVFSQRLDHINQVLQARQAEFKQQPVALAEFVDQELLPLWDSPKTVKALLGKRHWQSLSQSQQQEFSQVFDNTLQRYVQEGFRHYDGQQLEFVGVSLNEAQTRGYLTVRVIPNLLPSFEVKLSLAFDDQGLPGLQWQIFDGLFQGVSYISLKKDKYQQQLQELGVDSLIRVLQASNQGYFPAQLPGSITSQSASQSLAKTSPEVSK